MIYQIVLFVWCFLLDVFAITRLTDDEKDLEILLLRQQLRIVERQQVRGPTLPRWQKIPLVALVVRLKAQATTWRDRLAVSVVLFKPDTLLKWHRDLVRRKWTFKRRNPGGRPAIEAELEGWIVRLAHENPRWGFDRIHGELLKLGFQLDPKTVKNVMRRHHLLPAPQRGASSWCTFLGHYKHQMLACDFFTVETLRLHTVYVQFFIELGTRRVYLAGGTEHPDSAWIAQQARQLTWQLADARAGLEPLRFLIHDHDPKFTPSFDAVFAAEGMEIVLTPCHAPRANAIAERWIRSVRQEALDPLIVLGQWHLRHVLVEYVDFYNRARPHQGIEQGTPIRRPAYATEGPIGRREVLGGVLHDYFRQAA